MIILATIALALFVLPSPWGPVAIVGAMVVELGELWLWRKYLRRHRVVTGREGLVGERGEVVQPVAPEGTVRLRGEIWKARSGEPLGRGQRVRVAAVEGLTLEVEADA